jgi:hypothetical protein
MTFNPSDHPREASGQFTEKAGEAPEITLERVKEVLSTPDSRGGRYGSFGGHPVYIPGAPRVHADLDELRKGVDRATWSFVEQALQNTRNTFREDEAEFLHSLTKSARDNTYYAERLNGVIDKYISGLKGKHIRVTDDEDDDTYTMRIEDTRPGGEVLIGGRWEKLNSQHEWGIIG